jgi:gluconolactonase
MGDANCLLFSDIPNNRIVRWSPDTGVSTYRAPSNFSNGQTRDRVGRLISCEHGGRRVTRTEWDGTITVLAALYQGKRLNSPNDVVVHSDGSIWFTDPHYGIATNYEGYKAEQELPCNVYRIAPDGTIQAILTDFNCPNGLCFSPDETRLYVADTGRIGHPDPQHIRVFDMTSGQPRGGAVFHVINPGCADGMRVDSEGNLWSSARDGVHCIAPDGTLLGKVLVPEIVSNLCFGGRAKQQLFITATTSLYSIHLNRAGAQMP